MSRAASIPAVKSARDVRTEVSCPCSPKVEMSKYRSWWVDTDAVSPGPLGGPTDGKPKAGNMNHSRSWSESKLRRSCCQYALTCEDASHELVCAWLSVR